MSRLALAASYVGHLVSTFPASVRRTCRNGLRDAAQRFGSAPVRRGRRPAVWVHGTSLGEIRATRTLVSELHRRLSDFDVLISTTTDTGMGEARRLYLPEHTVFRWPLDFAFTVRKALRHIRPDLVVLMEAELWPNFLAECERRGIPVVVANARISADGVFPPRPRLGPSLEELLGRLTAIGAQNETYAEWFRSWGARPDRVHVTGALKFDTAGAADRVDGQDALQRALGLAPEDRLLVAGSTRTDEEESALLDMYADLRRRHDRLRLAIVPRIPEEFDDTAARIAAHGFACVRRSLRPDGTDGSLPDNTVILGDTLGELRKFYALAAVVFVGRSLVPLGGSDMIEAAALGRPTAFGPHTESFPQADALARHGCARVANVAELARQMDDWLSDPAAAAKQAHTARQYVLAQQGATRRTVDILCNVLRRRRRNRTQPCQGGDAR